MAVVTVTTDLDQTAGVPYTVITDSSSDWGSVSNSVYFFDKATKLTYYKNSSGTVVSLFEEGGGTTNLSIKRKNSTILDIVSSDGTDATVPAVTTSEAGLSSAADKTKLDGIEAGATTDQTDGEIETAYNNQVAVATQAEAEAGTSTDVKRFTPQRVKQAIDALAGGGSGNAVTLSVQKDSSGTINKGQVVRLSDYDIVADVTTVELADNSAGSTMPAIGIATSSIGIASTGTVVVLSNLLSNPNKYLAYLHRLFHLYLLQEPHPLEPHLMLL